MLKPCIHLCFSGTMSSDLHGRSFLLGALAQLARAPALQAGGPGFESPTLHQVYFENTTYLVCGRLAQLVRARHCCLTIDIMRILTCGRLAQLVRARH